MNQSKSQNTKKKSGGSAVYAVIAILLAAVIILSLLRGCDDREYPRQPEDTPTQGSGIIYDDNAVIGGWEEADTEEIIDNLNQKVEEGMINISMNTTPNFANGTSAGNLMIVNESINRYPQVVEITRNDTGELIYKSGAIAVGSKIESAKLKVDLDMGTYECTALFYNVDPNTGEYIGCAGAIIYVNIIE